MTEQDAIFRPLLIGGFLVVFFVTLYHRIQSGKTRESLDRRQEGLFILATLRPLGLLFWAGVFAYVINPAWMAWSSMPIPAWLRWTAAGVSAAATGFLAWTLRSLGTNLTDTVVTRQAHTLVIHGPYRWVRHPFYVSFTLLMVATSFMAANWFLLLTGTFVLLLLVMRTRTEEEKLTARFGEAYRSYMKRTGRFFPKRMMVLFVLVVVSRADSAAAQATSDRFEVGVQIATAVSSQFDSTDAGIGGRLAWRPIGLIGVEGELTLYPGDFPSRGFAFSRARVEGLFGVTAGRTFERVRPFARLRPGFLSIREAPAPFACIAIFPPPLSCVLGAGRTLFALDIGGGIDVTVTPKTFVRVDVGDRLLKYPGPVFESSRTVREEGFFSHDFRFAAAGGIRF